jgi:transposase
MGHPAGVKLDRVRLEQRRMRAARLLRQAIGEAEVARRVGVHRQSVNRWAKQLAKGGRRALKRAPRTGRPPQLSAADRQRIVQGLKRGPGALGYRAGPWTAWRVADLIERECGVKYSVVHAWRVLRSLAGAHSGPLAVRWSATKRPSAGGNASDGRS